MRHGRKDGAAQTPDSPATELSLELPPDGGASGDAWTLAWALGFAALALVAGIYLFASVPAIRVGVLVGLAILLPLGLYGYARWRRLDPARDMIVPVYAVVLLLLGLVFAFFFPHGTVPDEGYHFVHAYKYANVMAPGVELESARKEDVRFMDDDLTFVVSEDAWRNVGRDFSVFASQEGYVPVSSFENFWYKGLDVTSDPVQTRVFAAIGINIARLFNLSGIMLFYVGRLFNLVVGAALIILAVKVTPVGRNVMMCVSLLPITLHVLGSYSYDSTVIGLSFLLLALTLRMLYGEDRIRTRHMASYLVVATLLAPCKVVYTALVLIVLLVPSQRFSSRRTAILFKALAFALPAAAILLTRMVTMVNMLFPGAVKTDAAATSGVSGPGRAVFYSASYILQAPLGFLKILARTFWRQGDDYLLHVLGGSLGWLQGNLVASRREIVVLFLLAVFGFVSDPSDKAFPKGRERVLFAVVFALVLFALEMSMFVGWTPEGNPCIEGVQGRYFIPVLPLVYLAVRNSSLAVRKDMKLPMLIGFGSFNCLYLARIAFTVLGGL